MRVRASSLNYRDLMVLKAIPLTTNVTTRNIIASMRLVSDVDWTELVERVSLFDDVLQSGSDFSSLFLGSALLLWREQFRERVAQFR